MNIAQAVFSIRMVAPNTWSIDWAWGLPLIVVAVVIHVLGLGLIGHKIDGSTSRISERRHPTVSFVVVVGTATLLATFLHAVETAIWAAAYRLLDALPDARSAMLYSLSAITSYGHASLELKQQWQLMGALEALNGWLLFGLTTAFLFSMIEKVRLVTGKRGRG